MSKPIFWEKKRNNINLPAAELAQRVVKIFSFFFRESRTFHVNFLPIRNFTWNAKPSLKKIIKKKKIKKIECHLGQFCVALWGLRQEACNNLCQNQDSSSNRTLHSYLFQDVKKSALLFVLAALVSQSDGCQTGDQEVPGLIPTRSCNILS